MTARSCNSSTRRFGLRHAANPIGAVKFLGLDTIKVLLLYAEVFAFDHIRWRASAGYPHAPVLRLVPGPACAQRGQERRVVEQAFIAARHDVVSWCWQRTSRSVRHVHTHAQTRWSGKRSRPCWHHPCGAGAYLLISGGSPEPIVGHWPFITARPCVPISVSVHHGCLCCQYAAGRKRMLA
jgi:hypothetical protein